MDTKVPSTAITSINGMRVLSMWWVILGHTYDFSRRIPVSEYSKLSANYANRILNHQTNAKNVHKTSLGGSLQTLKFCFRI